MAINYRFVVKRDTAANFTAANTLLLQGEFGLETDTGKFKIGNGVTAWNSLNYYCAVPLADPGADSLLFWDDSASIWKHLTLGTGLSITGTTINATGGSGGGASSELYVVEDFLRGVTTSTATGTSYVTNNVTPVAYLVNVGTTAALGAADSTEPGYVTLGTGTGVFGVRLFLTAGNLLRLGGGVLRLGARVRLPTLSTGTQRYSLSVGLANGITGATRSIIATYADNINSGNWRLSATNGAGTTDVDTASVGPSANAWTTVEIEINAAASSATLYVDGASVATITGNIPTADGLAFGVLLSKVIGSTARTVDVGFMELRQTIAR